MEHETEHAAGFDGTDDGNGVPPGQSESSPAEPGPGSSIEPGPQASLDPDPQPGTGEARVDAALKLLDRLPGLPVSEHPELFEQVHAQLADVLGELDSGSGGS
jgi:hypothetical protein